METNNSNNVPKKKGKINALIIVGIVLLFAGGVLAAPAKYIVFAIGAAVAIAGFIKARKAR